MRSTKKQLSDKEIAVYYDSQSEDEIVQEMESADWEPVEISVRRTKSKMSVVPLPVQTVATVKRIAQQQGIDYQILLHRWIEERIEQETSRR